MPRHNKLCKSSNWLLWLLKKNRQKQENDKIASCYQATFNTPAGEQVIEDLFIKSLNAVIAAEISDDELKKAVGALRLVKQIINKI